MITTKKPVRPGDARRDQVGYANPPRHSRFKPGQSCNPKGRPKGTRNFATDLAETLQAPVNLTRDGKPTKVSTQKAALLRLREKALNGDARALDRLLAFAQAYGPEEVEHIGSVSAEDKALLEIFIAKVKAGAAEPLDD
jgi:hypothetical protein